MIITCCVWLGLLTWVCGVIYWMTRKLAKVYFPDEQWLLLQQPLITSSSTLESPQPYPIHGGILMSTCSSSEFLSSTAAWCLEKNILQHSSPASGSLDPYRCSVSGHTLNSHLILAFWSIISILATTHCKNKLCWLKLKAAQICGYNWTQIFRRQFGNMSI